MNYEKLYKSIVTGRISNVPNGYKERHHIIPKSIGGTNESDNLVFLTAREHFICHYLLTKMYERDTCEWYKMVNAFLMMKCSSYNQYRYFNSRLYESLKNDFSKTMSISQSGKKNSNYGKMWISNIESRKNRKINKDEPIPENWIKGRNKWKPKRGGDTSKRKKRTEENKRKAEYYWKMFLDGEYESLNDFAKTDYPYSQPNLIITFKKHIPKYSEMFKQGKRTDI